MGMERFNKKLHIARRGVVYSLVLCCLILLIEYEGTSHLPQTVSKHQD